ncbi:hypothetical protein [Herbiconiux solani]|uniref:hypothetical protein n=1 Tax=Herbiconiux solani TaxID=661329 RepID=UPI0008264923|nr:hypothetical protein [Herbiconiux solani]
MSTDDRQSDQPEFPMRDADGHLIDPATPRSDAAGADSGSAHDAAANDSAAAQDGQRTSGLPDMPAWDAPAGPAVVIPEPIRMPADDAAIHRAESASDAAAESPREDAAGATTRDPLGGPYVVDEAGSPISEQAVKAYDRAPQGGPYVTASEPEQDAYREAQAYRQTERSAEPQPERTPYPAAAYAPAAAAAAYSSAAPAAAPVNAANPGAPAAPGETFPAYLASPQPLTAPVPPRPKGNRGAGSLIALAGTVLFALVYGGVGFLIILANLSGEAAVSAFTSFLASAAFIVPVVVFALALILIVLIVNRAGWWAYVLGGFLVAVLVYFGAIAGALIHVQAWAWQPQEQYDFVRSLTMDPLTLAAAIVAREASIWTGAFIALRGRRLKARNVTAREEFDREQRELREQRERDEAQHDPAAPSTTW